MALTALPLDLRAGFFSPLYDFLFGFHVFGEELKGGHVAPLGCNEQQAPRAG